MLRRGFEMPHLILLPHFMLVIARLRLASRSIDISFLYRFYVCFDRERHLST